MTTKFNICNHLNDNFLPLAMAGLSPISGCHLVAPDASDAAACVGDNPKNASFAITDSQNGGRIEPINKTQMVSTLTWL